MEQTISHAAQVILSLIPIIGIVFVFVLIFFALLWRHHEIKLQIETKTFQPAKYDWKALALLTGLGLTAVGTVLTLMFYVMNKISWGLLGGLIPLSLGIVLMIFCKFLKNEK